MKAFQLHDSETEEIIGTVTIVKEENNEGENELWEGWEDFNKSEEHELDRESIIDFIGWFNEGYLTQIEEVEMEFIQPSMNN